MIKIADLAAEPYRPVLSFSDSWNDVHGYKTSDLATKVLTMWSRIVRTFRKHGMIQSWITCRQEIRLARQHHETAVMKVISEVGCWKGLEHIVLPAGGRRCCQALPMQVKKLQS